MASQALLKIIRQFYINTADVKNNQMLAKKQLSAVRDKAAAGFTMIEMLAVVIIIGVLSAIAAPGWLAFTNQQRVSKVNDAVLSALQTAQMEAKRTKLSYSVSFQINNGVLQFAVYQPTNPSSIPSSTSPFWENLGKNLDIRPGQVLLGSNLSQENTANPPATDLSFLKSSNPTQTQAITFNYMGNVTNPNANASFNSNGGKGLIIAVAAPQVNSATTPINSTKRCVIVKTILGSMQTGQGTECNTN